MPDENTFLTYFKGYAGKYFNIVTGRNAYTFDKFKHAKMLQEDGTYLLLENQPEDTMKHKYNRALFIGARVVDGFFATNEPEKVKTGFYVGADKMRLSFNKQSFKLYEMEPMLIKEVRFEDTRRAYHIDRAEYEHLKKNDGVFIFLLTVGKNPNILLDTQVVRAKSLAFEFDGNTKKSVTMHFELSAYALKMLDDFGWRKLLTKEKVPPPPIFKQETITAPAENKVVEQYLRTGLPITIVFPEGEHELVLECTITKQERRKTNK